ncbi:MULTISPECIES: hypothetical protein [unclassified Streptomyces]|uniref:hypothetical protein n=1 Tax=unclassified Streptomyces TaxID=2593676 RepID=UPI000DBA2712|nr:MULTISPECIES: hypothetical protein [unclassified Streptomyces]MYU06393.1 hypothetical protein [Streptomyces sp. SID8366]MYU68308.1 hypothetical protein [Streptomyces sp. SID69]RAJ56194.1 hypothetical protein K376_04179 [Streptomyces sp. PsTaAH-130]
MGLYTETHIRADLDRLWAHTQDPVLHRRWYLLVTELHHLPSDPGEPRPFRFTARLPPFLTLSGTGVSAGEKERPDGTRTSALCFSSTHPLGLIAEGGGYWRYVPDDRGVRFLTGYDYRPRGGALGAAADRLLVRPLLDWATAWSFDRLRLWLERGITPERALCNWLAEIAVRVLLLAACLGGLRLERLMRLFGSFAAAMAYLCPVLLLAAVCLALFKSPLDCTPAARRCLRAPATRIRAPRLLRTLQKRVEAPA